MKSLLHNPRIGAHFLKGSCASQDFWVASNNNRLWNVVKLHVETYRIKGKEDQAQKCQKPKEKKILNILSGTSNKSREDQSCYSISSSPYLKIQIQKRNLSKWSSLGHMLYMQVTGYQTDNNANQPAYNLNLLSNNSGAGKKYTQVHVSKCGKLLSISKSRFRVHRCFL